MAFTGPCAPPASCPSLPGGAAFPPPAPSTLSERGPCTSGQPGFLFRTLSCFLTRPQIAVTPFPYHQPPADHASAFTEGGGFWRSQFWLVGAGA